MEKSKEDLSTHNKIEKLVVVVPIGEPDNDQLTTPPS